MLRAPNPGGRIDQFAEFAALLDETPADERVEFGQFGRAVGQGRDAGEFGGDNCADLFHLCLGQVRCRDIIKADHDGKALIGAEIAEYSLGADIHTPGLAVDEETVEVCAGVAREAVEEELKEQGIASVEFTNGGPAKPDVAGLLLVFEGEVDDLDGAGRGGLGMREIVLALGFASNRGRIHGAENLIEAGEFLGNRFPFRKRNDGAHVSEIVMMVVKIPDIGGLHFADAGGVATRVVAEGVVGTVDVERELAEECPVRIVHGTGHFVVDRSLLFEPELVGGCFGDAEVADFAANFFIGVVGMEEALEEELELVVEDGESGFGVEVVARAPLHGEGIRFGERHAFAGGEGSSHVAFAHEEVLLGVGFAFARDREGIYPDEGLRDGLHLNEIEGEAGFLVHETRAEGLIRVIEVDGGGAEAVAGCLFGDIAECGRTGGRWSGLDGKTSQRDQQQESESSGFGGHMVSFAQPGRVSGGTY